MYSVSQFLFIFLCLFLGLNLLEIFVFMESYKALKCRPLQSELKLTLKTLKIAS